MNKKVLIIAGAVLGAIIIILVVVAVLAGGGKDTEDKAQYPSGDVTLTWWHFDNEEALEPIIEAYQKEHKNVTIEYVKKDPKEYETELINALAGGSGPDLFMIRNDWLTKHQDKLEPMPEDYMSIDEYKNTFAPVAAQDLISDDRIYGIPFYIDTLALFYNKKLINDYNDSVSSRRDLTSQQKRSLRILKPPKNWTELIDHSKKLTNKSGTYVNQAGTALGTSNNIESSEDILSLLMIQNNTQMVSEDKKTPTFNLPSEKETGGQVYPGTSALDFYTSFALPSKETYSWNSNLASSTEAFIQSKTTMMFNYSYVINTIENLAPDLDFGISEMPQVKGVETRTDYASYWPEAVSKDSQYPQVAWDFLKFASEKVRQRQYNQITKRPPSRLGLAESKTGTSLYGIFASQVSTATSWYKGKTPTKVDQTFQDMITAVVSQNQPTQTAIDAAAEKIKTLWKKE